MGEINSVTKKGNGLVKKSKKSSPGIDMTPVVDLAFLLLTFFMLTTTFIKPQVMELKIPEKKDEETIQPKVNEKKVLNIILGSSNRLYWFIGLTEPNVMETDYSITGIRKVLLEQNSLIDKMVVLIKPGEQSTYENLVNILDELEITDIERYALVEIEDEDRNIMNNYLGGADI